jgi:hypothetical protein
MFFSRMKGPVPTPGAQMRILRDCLLWPVLALLFALFWVIDLRRQDFEKEFGAD